MASSSKEPASPLLPSTAPLLAEILLPLLLAYSFLPSSLQNAFLLGEPALFSLPTKIHFPSL